MEGRIEIYELTFGALWLFNGNLRFYVARKTSALSGGCIVVDPNCFD